MMQVTDISPFTASATLLVMPKFWKPGTAGPGSTLDRASEQEGSLVQSAPLHSQRERLPIHQHRMLSFSLCPHLQPRSRLQASLLCGKLRCHNSRRADRLRKDNSYVVWSTCVYSFILLQNCPSTCMKPDGLPTEPLLPVPSLAVLLQLQLPIE